MKRSQKGSQKVVIKVGSSLLTGGGGTLVSESVRLIVDLVASFWANGDHAILVSSGAVACGLSVLGLKKRPADVAQLQAAAAAGQHILMQRYGEEFARHGLRCAQVLLTRDDFMDRRRYLNARHTLNALLLHGLIPIVNENDTVSVEEIRFGDNDTLSARLAVAVQADRLHIITDTDGLYRQFDPKTGRKSDLIRVVEGVTPEIERAACGTDKASCVGGMSTKIQAARIATRAGIGVSITAPTLALSRIAFTLPLPAEFVGTYFVADAAACGSKRHWIAFEASVAGKVFVDAGAREALVDKNRSLLAPGVRAVEGDFKKGDVVEIWEEKGACFAKGRVNYSSRELDLGKQKKFQ
ncbi:MAG: glutamate 5-kinase, partial [Deltaproteobacteria bacterium]